MTDNEIWCLNVMSEYGFVPEAEQIDIELVRMEYLPNEEVTSVASLVAQCRLFLHYIDVAGIRHGDLTRPNMLFNNNNLYVIDWSESRLTCDPRIDKRPGGDALWMKKTIKETFGITV